MAQEENKSETSSESKAQTSPEATQGKEEYLTETQKALDEALSKLTEQAHETGKAKKKQLFVLISIVSAVGIIFWWYLHRNEEETDDAYITGRKVAIAPHVSGYVYELLVNDNQFVHKGDVLIRVDGRDYITQLHNAQGQLAQAQANFDAAVLSAEVAKKIYPGQLMSAQGSVADAQANLFKAQTDYSRQHRVLRAATSQSDIDASTAQLESAEAKLTQARGNLIQAEPVHERVRTSEMQAIQGDAQLKSARAALEKAKLDVGWLTVRAPCDGWVSQRSVERGNFVQAGQHILSIVPNDIWIVANYKETQLKKMRAGQRVEIHVDAYPQLHLEGHVDSFQMGTGESFSTFPPENATGNFVKVVQRVPVKILIDKGLQKELPLPLGLSLTTVVNVGDKPAHPPAVKAPEAGAGDGSFNIQEMIEKTVLSGKDAEALKLPAKSAEKNLNLESPSESSPFASEAADKAMDKTLSENDKGSQQKNSLNDIADLAEKHAQEAFNQAKRKEMPVPKQLSPVSPKADQKPLSALLPDQETAEEIRKKALKKMEELGISKEALLDHFQEKKVTHESEAGIPVGINDPNTQQALLKMATEAVEGIKKLPLTPAKKAEIEKAVSAMARQNEAAWKLSPEKRKLIEKAIKQAENGGDHPYKIAPELVDELIKSVTSRDPGTAQPKNGKDRVKAFTGGSSETSAEDKVEEAPKATPDNFTIKTEESKPTLTFSNGVPNKDLMAGHNNASLVSDNVVDFDASGVKTQGNALGGNPLGAGIR